MSDSHMDEHMVVRHIGAKKYQTRKVVEPAEFKHNETICPACGQRVNVRMVLPYCDHCLIGSKEAANQTVEKKRQRNRYVLKEIIDVQKIEAKMSERAESFDAS